MSSPTISRGSEQRARLKNVALIVAVIFAAYLLVTQLTRIGLGTIADELRHAELVWVVIALIVAQATFIPSGISVRGGVATPLPLLPCIVLQSALKFVNLTVPSSAGRIATNLRCLQRMGAPPADAVAASAIDDLSNRLIQAMLVAVAIPFVGVELDTSQFKDAGPDRRLLGTVGIALVVGGVVVMAVPNLRAKAMMGVRDMLRGFWSVIRVRRNRLEIFAGGAASELLYALSLSARRASHTACISTWRSSSS
jgi:hypothetical protein